jgi:hypothetical protein
MAKREKPSVALRKRLFEQFSFEDDASLSILETAMQSLDLMADAQAQIDKDGLTVKGDRGQIKAHPLLAVIRDARSGFLQSMKALKLEIGGDEQPAPVGRPTNSELEKKRRGGVH